VGPNPARQLRLTGLTTWGRAAAALCVAALAIAAAPGDARASEPERERQAERACVPLAKGERVRIDLHDVSLRDVGRIVSCAAEVPLLFAPPSLGGKIVSVVGPRPVDRGELIGLWHTLLRSHGLMAERRGAWYVIREASVGG